MVTPVATTTVAAAEYKNSSTEFFAWLLAFMKFDPMSSLENSIHVLLRSASCDAHSQLRDSASRGRVFRRASPVSLVKLRFFVAQMSKPALQEIPEPRVQY